MVLSLPGGSKVTVAEPATVVPVALALALAGLLRRRRDGSWAS
jgi:hypothetical protein